MLAIAARELRSLFVSPLAWAVLAVTTFIHAWIFLLRVDLWSERLQPAFAGEPQAPGVTDMVAVPLLGTAAMVLLLVIPLLTMRVISEERRTGSLRLLQSSPVSMSGIVLGKFLAILGFASIMVALVALMPLSLSIGTTLDLGKLAGAVLALWLLVGAFAAAGLWVSSLTRQPAVAAIVTFGLLLLLWMIDWAAEPDAAISRLSIIQPFQGMSGGRIAVADLAWYPLFMVLFLGLAIHRMDGERLNG
jgi:ABC-2 type transport system permease protein